MAPLFQTVSSAQVVSAFTTNNRYHRLSYFAYYL